LQLGLPVSRLQLLTLLQLLLHPARLLLLLPLRKPRQRRARCRRPAVACGLTLAAAGQHLQQRSV
jgi:hypothetical protein